MLGPALLQEPKKKQDIAVDMKPMDEAAQAAARLLEAVDGPELPNPIRRRMPLGREPIQQVRDGTPDLNHVSVRQQGTQERDGLAIPGVIKAVRELEWVRIQKRRLVIDVIESIEKELQAAQSRSAYPSSIVG